MDVFSGSGVASSTLWVALKLAGATSIKNYDGGWTEWSSREKSPIKSYLE